MKKIHVYKVNGQPYASAAEVVPAILSKGPIKATCHSVTTDIQGALLAAIGRATDNLRYTLAKNIQASLVSAALLILLAWPLVYLAIPLPEVTLAARITSGVCAALSLLAAVATGIQIRRLSKRSSMINTVTTAYRDDRLLPSVTAWRQSPRHISFPWLGLGLVLFSIALNCVVVGSYANPAILSDGTVHYSMGIAAPWTSWESGFRYISGSFYATYGYDEETDMFYALKVTYRVENTDVSTLPPTGWKHNLYRVFNNMTNGVSGNAPEHMPPGASEEDIRLAIEEYFEYNTEDKAEFIDSVKTYWAERYGAQLKLVYVDYEVVGAVSRAEAARDYKEHAD